MSPWIRSAIVGLLLLASLFTYNIGTYNAFTRLGFVIVWSLGISSLVLSVVVFVKGSWRCFWAALACSSLCLLLVVVLQAKSPSPSKGFIIDSREAWRRYQHHTEFASPDESS